ncbi:hypothetical protein GCM10009828_001630 [Actinoplanes couchii]|uniref:Uncharacterized protein n=1 Tax=Actinoplanes couchii TaxID=403638 RepID=A0ABQ3XSX2_9ACTN|nr:hypothetical protein Aco03nite_100210 [Actinoplanes couchii]
MTSFGAARTSQRSESGLSHLKRHHRSDGHTVFRQIDDLAPLHIFKKLRKDEGQGKIIRARETGARSRLSHEAQPRGLDAYRAD